MKIGYSYWGYLADEKYDKNGNMLSTPDGNTFYSWSLIHELLDRGNEVYQMMPNRDKPAEYFFGKDLMFNKFCTKQRRRAYNEMHKEMYESVDWTKITKEELFAIWDAYEVKNFDCIIHEWRMLIPGRNSMDCTRDDKWQPDYAIQKALIDYCSKNDILLIIFDLDYKLTQDEYMKIRRNVRHIKVFELGHKWKGEDCYHFEIPFDTEELKTGYKKELRTEGFETELVYIGNRYERDKCIDRYIPQDVHTTFYGNWLQPKYSDCKDRWPFINYRERLQASQIPAAYDKSLCTILLAKEEYYKYGFMTARILEALYYGCLPLFPLNYGVNTIHKYAGDASDWVTVVDSNDVSKVVKHLKNNPGKRNELIEYMRQRLDFMDVRYVVNVILCICSSKGKI